jgi:hypothetical protein
VLMLSGVVRQGQIRRSGLRMVKDAEATPTADSR